MQKDSSLINAINKIANRLTTFVENVETVKGKKPEAVVLILYCIGHILMLLAHEPWFDEALAWLIARDSSLEEIFFVAPHYEGHPSLWHLVLLPFAKLGAPYELSLNLISLLFSGGAVALILYRSSFKRIIRLMIPFTYFVFYQYSVVSRPYSMMMMALCLVALSYKNRDLKPGRFILSLLFLCMTGAYGIVISGGICIAWLYKLFAESLEKSRNKNSENGEYRGVIRVFIEDGLLAKKKLFWFILLLVYAVFVIIRIIPAEDTYAIVNGNLKGTTGIITGILYAFFGTVSDSFITNSYSETSALQNTGISLMNLIPGVIIGGILVAIIIYYSYKKAALIEFLIPYMLLALFMAVVYLFNTHIGIMFLFMGFWIWVLNDKEDKQHDGTKKESETSLLKSSGIILATFSLFILLYWNISSCVCDIIYEYGYGRNEYEFLKENGVEDSLMLPEWITGYGTQGSLLLSKEGVSIAPYLDRSALLISSDVIGYSYAYTHKMFSKDELNIQKEKIKESGAPEVLLGLPDLEDIFNTKEINITDYTKAYEERSSVIFKGVPGSDSSAIYFRNTD